MFRFQNIFSVQYNYYYSNYLFSILIFYTLYRLRFKNFDIKLNFKIFYSGKSHVYIFNIHEKLAF